MNARHKTYHPTSRFHSYTLFRECNADELNIFIKIDLQHFRVKNVFQSRFKIEKCLYRNLISRDFSFLKILLKKLELISISAISVDSRQNASVPSSCTEILVLKATIVDFIKEAGPTLVPPIKICKGRNNFHVLSFLWIPLRRTKQYHVVPEHLWSCILCGCHSAAQKSRIVKDRRIERMTSAVDIIVWLEMGRHFGRRRRFLDHVEESFSKSRQTKSRVQ